MKKIIHVDMDAFYASVEQAKNPSLRGKPIIVGGEEKRGVVATCSYEARAFGVYSAMPMFQAKKKCPHAIFLKPNMGLYKEVSQQLKEIFLTYTPLVEPLALDEAYLDVTDNLIGEKNPVIIGKKIKQDIWSKLELIASVGISYNKFLAKIASEKYKPNGLGVVSPKEAEALLEELAIEEFYGIGRVTAAKMQRLGIKQGKDLKGHSFDFLKSHFGKMGESYYYLVRGHDFRKVIADRQRKSLGRECTFAFDIDSEAVLKKKLQQVTEELLNDLEKKGVCGRTLTVKVKSGDFQVSSRSFTVAYPLKKRQDILSLAEELFQSLYQGQALRLIGISLSKLLGQIPGEVVQEQLTLPFKEFATAL